MLRYRGTEIMLVRGKDDKAAFRTSISLSIAQKDNRLKTMTRDRVISLYADQFDRFDLITISREKMFGMDSVTLSFCAGSPRLYFKQWMFERGGRSYVVTLMAENTVKAMPDAWRLFDSFCDSLFFVPKRMNKDV